MLNTKKQALVNKRYQIPVFIVLLFVGLAAIITLSIFAPTLFPIDLAANDLTKKLEMPIFADSESPYLFGTDKLGRDLAIRLLYATRSTILISFTGTVIATISGTALGIIAGLCGGKVDYFISFLTDVRLSIPTTFIGIICACIMSATPTTTIIVISFTGWSAFCRLVRSQIFHLKSAKFIEASRAMGGSQLHVVFDHILINIASPLIVQATMALSEFILLESTLSFLGLGIQPPGTSLGVLVSEGRDLMLTHWWLCIIPSAVIVLLILQISLIGDWLRDRLDPKLKNK